VATYLYGLILARNTPRVPARVTGLTGSALRVAVCGELGALVSTVDSVPARPGLEDVRAHDSALRLVVSGGVTAAASRFGQHFPGDEELCGELETARRRLTALLEEYDGCVEMRVLLSETPSEPQAADAGTPSPGDLAAEVGPGRAYLESLRGGDIGKLAGVALRPALGPLVFREHIEPLARSGGVVFAHLVRGNREQEYREAIAALPALAEARVIGPLPLYVFSVPE
jgi:hypothetical protein